jgi:hypothetical protein
MLLAIYAHIFERGLQDSAFPERHCVGKERLQQFPRVLPEEAADMCGVSAETITRIAEGFATAPSASAVCKMGVNTSRNGTLSYWLVEALNPVTANVDAPGGLVFNPGILDLNFLAGMSAGRRKRRSRLLQVPGGRSAPRSAGVGDLPRPVQAHGDSHPESVAPGGALSDG